MSLALNQEPFVCDVSRRIWEAKYRYRDAQGIHDHAITDTWRRVARALAMLGIVYGSAESLVLAGRIMETVCHAAYRASIGLAREKGAFPAFRAEDFLSGEFVRALPPDYPYPEFRALFESAYARGLKGCTAFRPNPVTGQVLVAGQADGGAQCCSLEREAD